jgi:DNA-binding CsgD family transcriptional regulator/tetratricopeptide (TPR) repeat protein
MAARFTSPGFVGRAPEFARLAAALEDVASGRPATMLVAADAGLGASRFLDEATARIAALPEPYTVIRCGRAEAAGGRPYGTVLEGLRPILRAVPDDELASVVSPNGDEVVRLLPDLVPRLAALGLLPDRRFVSDPERRQSRLLEAILGVLSRLGASRPVALLIDDLHRVDPGTRSLAAFVARVSRGQRVGLVGAYQPDGLTRAHPLHATLMAMAGSPHPPATIQLRPLLLAELAELVTAIEGERPTASTLLLVHERSRGSPLLAEELLAARRELSGASLTAPLEALVTARLARRSPECRRALRLLAPADRPVARSELADIAAAYETGRRQPPPRSTTAPRRGDGVLDADLTAGVAEAIEHGFLVERHHQRADGTSEVLLDVRHELVAAAISGDLLPQQRPRHQAALAAAAADRPAIALRHWLAAHEPGPARGAALAAAAEAEAVDAPEAALEHLELGLELTDATEPAGGADAPGQGRRAARDGSDDLLARAAEAANAAGDAARAAAFAEAALAGIDERSDPLLLGLRLERLAHYRWAAGDHDGAVHALRRASRIVPSDAPVERARVLAALAQILMIDGLFRESIRLARLALAVAGSAEPEGRGAAAHAMTTLGVAEGWGDDPELAVEHLREARRLAESAGTLDEVFRVYANLTTILDLHGRREEAVDVAMDGIETARRVGQEAVYGNFLRGNAVDSLFYLGRWEEARALAATSLEWSPAGFAGVYSAIGLATIEVEARSGELAGRLLGRLLLELETVPDPQQAPPVYQAAASYALWQADTVDARRAAELGWERVRGTEDWAIIARMASTVLEVAAAELTAAQQARDLGRVARARALADDVLGAATEAVARSRVGPSLGSRREADARLATARAYRARMDGRDEPAVWESVAAAWSLLADRYQVAKARWRQAEAALGAGDGRAGRRAARRPLVEAASFALQLGAMPLLRELRELSRRALITLPPELDDAVQTALAIRPASEPGARREPVPIPVGGTLTDAAAVMAALEPVMTGRVTEATAVGGASPLVQGLVGSATATRDTFGLSPREREVLSLIALGRTNREIGDRLFISQKTVGVHVGNILAKLGVSGRVEAAAVAIRLGLTERH